MISASSTDSEQQRDDVAPVAVDAARDLVVSRFMAACDPALHPLIEESDELRRDEIIEEILVDHLGVVIERTLRRKVKRLTNGRISAASMDDVRSTVFLRLLKRLRALPAGSAPIQNLAGYATMITLNACDDALREAFPQRTLLKNRIRYVLHRDDRFALWFANEHMVCGFAEWQERTDGNGDVPDAGDVRSRCSDATSLPEILLTLFRIANTPVELEAVVTTVASMSGIVDEAAGLRATGAESLERSEAPLAANETEGRDILGQLWGEIVALNLPQRVAFLLNLRDDTGDTATPLFVTTGVATIDQIAAALEMPKQDFAALWNDLPIEDSIIARILGVTRQQVINLRSAARKRLARRMSRFNS